MNTPILDKYLNPLQEAESILDEMDDADEADNSPVIEIPVGELDPRLKRTSYSSSLKLHECPRKFQLYKLHAQRNPFDDDVQSITFSYGHVVGQGCQDVLENKSKNDIFMEALKQWEPDLLAEDVRAKKDFFRALIAVEKFNYLRNNGFLADYELMYYEGKPAVELGFLIEMPDGFQHRGFADAVLRHKVTGQIVVVDFKTTKYRDPSSSNYKNSAQAIGYSIVLDHLSPGLSAYTVLYFVYSSTTMEYTEFPFDKSLLQRAFWLRNLLYDKHLVELYSNNQDQFPAYGESCFSFFRDCEYLSLCGMETSRLAKPLTQKILDDMAEEEKKYQFRVKFEDLVQSQLKRDEL